VATDLAGKRIELLHEVVPGLRRLAIMGNVGNPLVVLEMGEVQAAARTLGLDVVTSGIWRAEDIAPAFEAFKRRADALFVVLDPLINSNRLPIASLALGARLPTMHGLRVGRSRGSYVLCSKFPGPVPAHRRVGGQDSARVETRRYPGRAADKI